MINLSIGTDCYYKYVQLRGSLTCFLTQIFLIDRPIYETPAVNSIPATFLLKTKVGQFFKMLVFFNKIESIKIDLIEFQTNLSNVRKHSERSICIPIVFLTYVIGLTYS